MEPTTNFYRDLPSVDSFAAATEVARHFDVPEDWYVVITDVVGSTKAIEAGAYKLVNSVGVSSIVAVLNVDPTIHIPFVFGGDGATLAIPPSIAIGVRRALLGAQQMARESFNLDLRIGMVPVGELLTSGQWLRLTKFRLSKSMTQPAFSGRGWELAEKLVKSNVDGQKFTVVPGPGIEPDASFEGFECRWQSVDAVNGHKLALLILATDRNTDTNVVTYQTTLQKIHEIYGDVAAFHPLRADKLRLSLSVRGALSEARIHNAGDWRPRAYLKAIGILARTLLGTYFLATKRVVGSMRWGNYRDEVVENTDFRKFDGMLRMIVDGNDEQLNRLKLYLEGERQSGRLVYGLNISSKALVTCFVRSYAGDHAHFVDGADGGYALASRELKLQLAALKN